MWLLKQLKTVTPSSLRLEMIYIFVLIQPMQIFCVDSYDDRQELRALEQTFGYDFTIPLEVGNVLIWKISGNNEPFTPSQFNEKNVQFGSEEIYLIFTKRCFQMSTIYYWLGRNTSLTDKRVAAKYSVLLQRSHLDIINIIRETEGMESDSFQRTMTSPLKLDDSFIDYLEWHLPSSRPNLYVVLGVRYSRIKKIPLSLGIEWLKRRDACLVLEVEYNAKNMVPIGYFCDSKANEKQINRSMGFANKFLSSLIGVRDKEPHFIANNKRSNEFKEFLEMLEDNRFYNPNEVDNSGDHLKNAVDFVIDRDVEISLFDVTGDSLRLNQTRPIHSSTFQQLDGMGYLLDTKSVAGVFLVVTDSDDIKATALQSAEKYLDETYPSSSGNIVRMRVVEKYLFTHVVDVHINLSDYPFVRGQLEVELW